jgi:hypothetical protein
MAPAFGTYRCPTERAVLDCGKDFVRTVTMVKGTHDLEMRIAALRAGILVHDQVAGMAFVFPLRNRDILEAAHRSGHVKLFFTPMHTIPSIFSHLNL